MELKKDNWSKQDIAEFQRYLESFRVEEKVAWTTNILKTGMPVLAISSPQLKAFAREIAKGNSKSFLDHMPWDYHENTAINGALICKLTDWAALVHYLDIYSGKVDNWASCDLLSFDIRGKEDKFLKLSQKYIQSPKPFVRRIGIVILFHFVGDKSYLPYIFNTLDCFTEETEYYVNMINAWLVCECFTKFRSKTLDYLCRHKLNSFTINKAIQKCRDSFRVSPEDKEMLLRFKV